MGQFVYIIFINGMKSKYFHIKPEILFHSAIPAELQQQTADVHK